MSNTKHKKAIAACPFVNHRVGSGLSRRLGGKEPICQRRKHREAWVWSLGWEGPLEEELETHSSILAWRIPRAEEPGGLQSVGSQRVGQGRAWAHTHVWDQVGFADVFRVSGLCCPKSKIIFFIKLIICCLVHTRKGLDNPESLMAVLRKSLTLGSDSWKNEGWY